MGLGLSLLKTNFQMKDKIFQLLKQAYSQLGLGDAVLQARAEMLESLGFVTDENVGDVVAKQKSSLEALQKSNDARVTAALKKAEEEAKKKAEEDAKKKAEEEALKAKEEAEKAAAEAARKAAENSGLSPELKAYFDKMEENRKAEAEQQRKQYEATIKGMQDTIKGLQDTKAKEDAARAKAERQAKILTKAKELGIPQSRIDEGFVIADDADDSSIESYLGTVKKNIDASKLPGGSHIQLGGGNATKEEVDGVADALLG